MDGRRAFMLRSHRDTRDSALVGTSRGPWTIDRPEGPANFVERVSRCCRGCSQVAQRECAGLGDDPTCARASARPSRRRVIVAGLQWAQRCSSDEHRMPRLVVAVRRSRMQERGPAKRLSDGSRRASSASSRASRYVSSHEIRFACKGRRGNHGDRQNWRRRPHPGASPTRFEWLTASS